jgi:hypothetical protein
MRARCSVNPPQTSANGIPSPRQDTTLDGPIAAAETPRVVESNLSYHFTGYEFPLGKSDH